MHIPNSGKIKVHDGSGTKTAVHLTGHGAPASASGRGNEPMPSTGKILSNNWGAQSLKKLKTPPVVAGGARSTGQTRFVQPTLAQTAVVPTPGLGNPRGIK